MVLRVYLVLRPRCFPKWFCHVPATISQTLMVSTCPSPVKLRLFHMFRQWPFESIWVSSFGIF